MKPADTKSVPYPNSYWVARGLVLAGEYPGDGDPAVARLRLGALLNAGVVTFIDLTDEGEVSEDAKPVPPYRNILRELAADLRTEATYVRFAIEDRGLP